MLDSRSKIPSRFRRGAVTLIAVAFAATAFAGCSSGGSSDLAQDDKVVPADPSNPVHFKWSEDPKAPSLVKIADEFGLWDKASIRPEYVGAVDSGQLPALLGTGDITFASFMFNRSLSAVAAGVDLKVIASRTYTTKDEPHMEYFVRKDSISTRLTSSSWKENGRAGVAQGLRRVHPQGLPRQERGGHRQGQVSDPVRKPSAAVTSAGRRRPCGDPSAAQRRAAHRSRRQGGVLRLQQFRKRRRAGSISASGKFIRKYPEQTREFIGILAKVANWGNAHPEEYRDIVAKLTGLPKEQITKYYYANNLILDKEQTGFWWGLAERVGTLTPEESKLKPEDIATNEFNPYAKSPALIDSQADNTEILTDEEI